MFCNLHPNPFCSLFPVPVYCCTSTWPLNFQVRITQFMFTITIKITMQISVKIQSLHTLVKSEKSEKFLHKRKKGKATGFSTKHSFIIQSHLYYWVAQLLSNLEMRVLTILRKTSNVESFSGKEEALVMCVCGRIYCWKQGSCHH